MAESTNRLDGWIYQVLRVTPDPVGDEAQGEESKKLIGYSLLISAVRCTLQYVVLPFILPVIGLAAGWSQWITMVITVGALVAIVTSLRRMWKTRYTHRYRYLMIAVPAFLMLAAFLVMDVVAVVS